MRALLGAVPSALFLLVPVFALLLKLAYLGSGRLYLEHLVVALYSHAFLCMAMLAFFVLVALDHAITPHWAALRLDQPACWRRCCGSGCRSTCG